MKNPPKIVSGQTYRITLELEAGEDYGTELRNFYSRADVAIALRMNDDSVVDVQRRAPRVEYFQPGDIVRSKESHRGVFSLGVMGFMTMGTGSAHSYGKDGAMNRDNFNSDNFEKVKV